MASDVESYRREWAAKTARRPEDIYIPRALRERSISEQVAEHAAQQATEVDGQMSLFDDPFVKMQLEHLPRFERFADEPVEVDPPVAEKPGDFRTAFVVAVTHDGETKVIYDIEQPFTVDRPVTFDEVRRGSRDVADWAHTQYLLAHIVDRFAPPATNEDRLRKAALDRGLVK